jgi:putative flippase GtrA
MVHASGGAVQYAPRPMGKLVELLLARVDRLIAPLPTTLQKLVRYSVASGTGVCSYLVILIIINGILGMPDQLSNVIAVAISAIPNYLVNRTWTWKQTGKNRLWGEIVPFWTMAFLGFVLSIFFVNYASDRWGTTLAIAAANISAFGVLWLARFLILDKVMWKVVTELGDLDEEQEEPTFPIDAG